MEATRLEKQFDSAMMEIYQRAKAEANYVATIFHQMLCADGGGTTARRLINDRTVSTGYTALWKRGRLDLTVEAMVYDTAKWHPLFEAEEIERAKRRLQQYGYFERL